MSAAPRMAELRTRRKSMGMVQATIWLPAELNAKLNELQAEQKVTKSEVVSDALKKVLMEEEHRA